MQLHALVILSKSQPNKHAKPKHLKKALHLFIYGLVLLASYRNSVALLLLLVYYYFIFPKK